MPTGLSQDEGRQIINRTGVTCALLFPLVALLYFQIHIWVTLDYRPFSLWATLALVAIAAAVLAVGLVWSDTSNEHRDAVARLLFVLYMVALYAMALYFLAQEPAASLTIGDPTPEGIEKSVFDAFNWNRIAIKLTFLVATPILAIVAVRITGLWHYWTFWEKPPLEPTRIAAAITFGAIFVLTEMFAFYTALGSDDDVAGSLEHYVWHILDAVPTLEVPQTLRWSIDERRFNTIGAGSALLAYKILIILPLITLVRSFIESKRRERAATSSLALSASLAETPGEASHSQTDKANDVRRPWFRRLRRH